jgi:hypothetical protein
MYKMIAEGRVDELETTSGPVFSPEEEAEMHEKTKHDRFFLDGREMAWVDDDEQSLTVVDIDIRY